MAQSNQTQATQVLPVYSLNTSYNYSASDWKKIRDCVAGERVIHDAGTKYLPKLSAVQKEVSYTAYKDRARFFNATARTLAGWAGSIFRKAPEVNAPPAVEPLLKDIDLAGTSFEELTNEATEEVLSIGRAGVLVEKQTGDTGRAYMRLFTAEEITDWATTVINGAQVLAFVELQYGVDQLSEDGKRVECVLEKRTLKLVDGLYTQTVSRSIKAGEFGAETTNTPTIKGQAMRFIPFVFLSAKGTKPQIQEPPLLAIATTNVHHYRRSADLCHGLHLSALPTPYSINDTSNGEPIELGSGTFYNFKGNGVAVGFLEWSGAGLAAVRQDMQDMLAEMAALGAAYITPPKREAESAEALSLKNEAQNSPLAKIASAVERGLSLALAWLCLWQGADDSAAAVRLNKDFDQTKLSASDLKTLSEALQSGGITPDVYAHLLAAAEVLPPELTAEKFAADLENAQAAKEVKQKEQAQLQAEQLAMQRQTTQTGNDTKPAPADAAQEPASDTTIMPMKK